MTQGDKDLLDKEALPNSIKWCIDNGKDLLGDAELALDFGRPSTALALAVLAQEEFAKAFLLQLIAEDAIP